MFYFVYVNCEIEIEIVNCELELAISQYLCLFYVELWNCGIVVRLK